MDPPASLGLSACRALNLFQLNDAWNYELLAPISPHHHLVIVGDLTIDAILVKMPALLSSLKKGNLISHHHFLWWGFWPRPRPRKTKVAIALLRLLLVVHGTSGLPLDRLLLLAMLFGGCVDHALEVILMPYLLIEGVTWPSKVVGNWCGRLWLIPLFLLFQVSDSVHLKFGWSLGRLLERARLM
jgi:hypothetical protein